MIFWKYNPVGVTYCRFGLRSFPSDDRRVSPDNPVFTPSYRRLVVDYHTARQPCQGELLGKHCATRHSSRLQLTMTTAANRCRGRRPAPPGGQNEDRNGAGLLPRGARPDRESPPSWYFKPRSCIISQQRDLAVQLSRPDQACGLCCAIQRFCRGALPALSGSPRARPPWIGFSYNAQRIRYHHD